MSDALRHLGKVSRAYEEKANEWCIVCDEYAEAKAAFTEQRAIFKVNARFNAKPEDKLSDVELESRAHADPKIASLYLTYLQKEAKKDALKKKLEQMQEQQANGRTAVVEERKSNEIHSSGASGAA